MNSVNPTVPRSKAEYVAQRLLDRIVTSNLSPGISIGTEADLLQQYKVSRPTLRESLRILESQGVLELRPGPRGGIMTSRPGMDILAHGLSVYLRMHDVPFVAVLKAREAIEPALAADAATNASDADLDAMQDSIDRMNSATDQDTFIKENRVFHSMIARSSGNPVMEIFWSAIGMMSAGEDHGVRYTESNRAGVVKAHRGILEAMQARNSALASERMAEHLGELELLVRKRYQYLLDQAPDIVARHGRSLG